MSVVRALSRAALTVLLVASLAGTFLSVRHILRNPLIAPVVTLSAEGIRAAVDRAMADAATPDRIAARLRALLAETPRNWLAIDAVRDVAAERQVPLPPDLTAAIATARAADESPLATAQSCAACAIDAGDCPLSPVLICQAPMVLTPAGDVAGIGLEMWHGASGAPVDRVNLALSVVGLGSVLLALPTEGGSALLGLGANVARLAHRMGLMTRPLAGMLLRAGRDGVDWAGVRLLKLADAADPAALRRLIRPAAFRPVAEVMTDVGRIESATGPVAALHLVRYIDDAADARRLAEASEALGPKVTGRLEMLGKSRLLSLTTRFSRVALSAVASLVGLIASLGLMLAHAMQHAALRGLRRAARKGAGPRVR